MTRRRVLALLPIVSVLVLPAESNGAPDVVPSRILIQPDQAVAFGAEFADPDGSLILTVENLPEGMASVQGLQSGGRRQLRVYGIAPPGLVEGEHRTVTWHASDGRATETLSTDLVTTRPAPLDSLTAEALSLVTAGHMEGFPMVRARSLGSRVLPFLSTLLADRSYEDHWYKVVLTIAAIGDTAYFDTLKNFIWNRFHGQVSTSTYIAVNTAQSSLYTFATVMPRVVTYLDETSHTDPWRAIPWSVRRKSPEQLAGAMANATYTSLAYADSPLMEPILQARAAEIRASISPGMSRIGTMAREFRARGLITTHRRIREKGIISEWESQSVFGGARR